MERGKPDTKRRHFSNLENCLGNAGEEFNAGCSYNESVDAGLKRLRSTKNDDIEDSRRDFFQLHGLSVRADGEMARIRQLVTQGRAIINPEAEQDLDFFAVDEAHAYVDDADVGIGAAPRVEDLNVVDAAAAAVPNANAHQQPAAAAPAAVPGRRKFSKCGSDKKRLTTTRMLGVAVRVVDCAALRVTNSSATKKVKGEN